MIDKVDRGLYSYQLHSYCQKLVIAIYHHHHIKSLVKQKQLKYDFAQGSMHLVWKTWPHAVVEMSHLEVNNSKHDEHAAFISLKLFDSVPTK